MSAWDHLNVILDHTDPRIVDACFVNTATIPEAMRRRYAEEGAAPVKLDVEKIREKGYQIIQGDVLQAGEQVRHDAELLMKLVLEHYREYTERTEE
jgi:2-phospho-L-lactate transferase/gluconeogenesis factor (CofD/UPF0052 family)